MTTNKIITTYEAAISDRKQAAQDQFDHRLLLDSWERKLKLYDAELLLNGAAEGKNAEERSARLLMASTESTECQSLRYSIEEERVAVAEAERRMVEATEICRLMRLQLALAVPDGVRELVA